MKTPSLYIIKCQQLVSRCVNLVQNFNPALSLNQQIHQYQVHQSLDIPTEGIINKSNVIGIRNIISHPLLRLSIYHLPKGIQMKLHDHPTMNVITYVMEGSMTSRIFNKHPDRQKQGLYNLKKETLKKGDLTLIEGEKDNLHQFEAEKEPCIFMDIIFPDYDEDQRVCTSFDAIPAADFPELYRLKPRDNYWIDMVDI